MRLTVLGCAGSFPRPDSPCSSYLLEAEGFRLVIDLGNGALSALQRHTGLYDVDAVVLSHLHPDHWFDLCPYSVAWKYSPNGPLPRLPVYGPKDTADRLGAAYGAPPHEFDLRTLAPGALEIGPFSLRLDRLNHPVETYGMRIEQGGRSLTYSADTGASRALVRLAEGTDAFLCEASFLDDPNNPPNLHLSGREAGEHAARAGVDRLLLTHLVAWNDDARAYDEATTAFHGDTALVTSGAVYEI